MSPAVPRAQATPSRIRFWRRTARRQGSAPPASATASQKLADNLDVRPLHRALDRFAAAFCPIAKEFQRKYQWGLMQIEYATDILSKSKADLAQLGRRIIIGAIALKEMTLIPAITHAANG